MKIVTPPLVVEIRDSFKNDSLSRKGYGEALLNLVVRSNDELVISLNGKWGEGKSTFVKMWQGLLTEAKVANIYIDAFANDYVDDAFVSMAGAIISFAEANIRSENREKAKQLKEKAKKVGGKLLSWSTKVGVKALTLGVIDELEIDALTEIKEDLAKDTSTYVGKYIEERLDSHAKDIELIKSFRELLSTIPSNLKENENKPLVVIIDELDRCKPTFAIEFLERIKHFFSVRNVVFVLVMNKEQLEASIRHVYGQEIDAHTYLQKFINVETTIPKRLELIS